MIFKTNNLSGIIPHLHGAIISLIISSIFFILVLANRTHASVAKSVDAADSKSAAHKACRFESDHWHHYSNRPLFSGFFISYFFLRFHTLNHCYTRLEAVFYFSYSFVFLRVHTFTTTDFSYILSYMRKNTIKNHITKLQS